MPELRIDLFSDVVTRPTAEMRRVMAAAPVGDEQKREDPSTNALQDYAAELTGKEAALFLPSGTMCNQIAARIHCRPGDEIIADKTSHIRNFECGGAAALSGAQIYPLEGERGLFTAAQVEAAIRAKTHHAPRSRMVVVEQTSNMGGGTIWPLARIQEIAEVARRHKLALHMDGARLMNAVVAAGVATAGFCEPFDSVWIDLSKGLGAPVGAVLAGSRDFIAEAWRWKHQFGGAMRQSGIIAAAGHYALRNHLELIAQDHANARRLAEGLWEIKGVVVEPVETNLVFFNIDHTHARAKDFVERLLDRGVRVSPGGPGRFRAVTHLDVNAAQIEEALREVRAVLEG